jgi:tetratricopeptide (TPR) repeat protein
MPRRVERAHALYDEERYEDALAAYEGIIRQGREASTDPVDLSLVFLRRGYCLRDLGRPGEAIRAFDDVVDRFRNSTNGDDQRRAAIALRFKGRTLEEEQPYAEALQVYDEVVAVYGGSGESGILDQVGHALRGRGSVCEELARPEDALDAYREVGRRFGDASDKGLRENVGWSLLSALRILDDLHRDEEAAVVYERLLAWDGQGVNPKLVRWVVRELSRRAQSFGAGGATDDALAIYARILVRFGGVEEPVVQEAVARSMARKGDLLKHLGRNDEADRAYDQSLAHIENSPALQDDETINWVLDLKARRLADSGQVEAAIRAFDDLISRFATAEEVGFQLSVVRALLRKAALLLNLERVDEGLAAYDDVIARTESMPRVHETRRKTLEEKARVLHDAGRFEEALEAYDDALAAATPTDNSIPALLLTKGAILHYLSRRAEAVVVFENVVRQTADGSGRSDDPEVLGTATAAALRHLAALATLGETEAMASVVGSVRDLVTEQPPRPRRPREPESDQTRLATRLRETLEGDCWLLLATAGDDPETRESMRRRALELYAYSEPWFGEAPESWDESAYAAALLRRVADSYAMLSQSWEDTYRASLPLFNRPLFEWAVRLSELDAWAEQLGSPLELRESPEPIEELIEEEREKAADADVNIAPAFAGAIWRYELVSTLCDSKIGSAALRTNVVSEFAPWALSDAQRWAGRAWHTSAEFGLLGIAILQATQAFYVASHADTVSSSDDLFPSKTLLAGLVRESGAAEWIEEQQIVLPEWLLDLDADD